MRRLTYALDFGFLAEALFPHLLANETATQLQVLRDAPRRLGDLLRLAGAPVQGPLDAAAADGAVARPTAHAEAAAAAVRLLGEAVRWEREFGGAYSNTRTRYGWDGDGAINARVVRHTSDPAAVAGLRGTLETEGALR